MTLFGKTIVGLILVVIGGSGYYFYSNSQKVAPAVEKNPLVTTPTQGK